MSAVAEEANKDVSSVNEEPPSIDEPPTNDGESQPSNSKNNKMLMWIKEKLLLIALVVLPVSMSVIYYIFIAADRYVSTAEIIVKDNSNSKVVPSAMDLILSGSGSSAQDALLVVNYLHSLDLVTLLQEELKLKDYYQSNGDFLSKLPNWASKEDYLKYYRDHFKIEHDDLSGIITIEAQTFSPDYAQKLADAAIKNAEVFVNSINLQLANKQLEFVNKELERSQDRLLAVRQEILSFQNSHNVVSPEEELKGVGAIIQELELKLAEDNTKLSAYRSYLNESSSQIQAVKASIASLKSQIKEEKKRLIGQDQVAETGIAPLNKMTAEFQRLELQQKFALDAYQLALTSIETARIDATNQLKHLVIVTKPSRSEDASYPEKLYNLFTITVILLMLYSIVRMLIAAIKDHRA